MQTLPIAPCSAPQTDSKVRLWPRRGVHLASQAASGRLPSLGLTLPRQCVGDKLRRTQKRLLRNFGQEAITGSAAGGVQSDDNYMRLALLEADTVCYCVYYKTVGQLESAQPETSALQAARKQEVPVGAVVVCENEIICCVHNDVEASGDPTRHAELQAIQIAAGKLGRFRLPDCTLYATLEPCPMCAGALLQARVGRVVYGARNTLLGADGSWIDMLQPRTSQTKPHPFHPSIEVLLLNVQCIVLQVVEGVLAEESAILMKTFFKRRRSEKLQDSPKTSILQDITVQHQQ